MAASYVTAVRTLLKGVNSVPSRWMFTRTPALCQCLRLHVARCRPLHVSPGETEVQRRSSRRSTEEEERRAKEEEQGEEEEEDGPEYIPQQKAKNPMMAIGFAWMIGLPAGIIGFLLAKREVDKNRLKQLKVRQRMKESNEGEYDGSRYRRHAQGLDLDR